ncbi:TerB family tellurite resistance protein [Butyrivibrio sp. AD3002]|uniref:TerB family tellurite resistance protein n=1 Tax=Butyrivibrio sp. AD3002 TaxID=1280670 RepID=UPI0003B762CE|nr:TerB family tellurite resistance protein [Butyrivibrio sp. AD3002]
MSENVKISKEDAIKIIYYLMAVDGEVCQAEEGKFDAIANEMDASFSDYKEKIVSECQEQLKKVIDEDEYYDVVQEGVSNAIDNSGSSSSFDFFSSKVSNRVVVWNLLTIAFSDGKYTSEERKLVKYVVRRMNVDKSVFLEMENTIKAIFAIDNEIKWIKGTSKPYAAIEAIVNELEDRRGVINNSMKELITL